MFTVPMEVRIIEDNEKEQTKRTGKPLIKDILLVLYALLAIAVAVTAIRTVLIKRQEIVTEREAQDVEKLTDSISFPQFEYIELKADKTRQKLTFYKYHYYGDY